MVGVNVSTVTGPTSGLEMTDASLFAEWISPPVAADVTISGTITGNIWAMESAMTANAAINVIIEIIRANTLTTRNSNTLVEIVRSTNAVELGTARSANNFTSGMTSGAYSSQTLNRGDRLRIRGFFDDGGGTMASGATMNASYNGASAAADGDSYVTFTENITFENPPGTVSIPVSASTMQNLGQLTFNEKLAQRFVASSGTLNSVSAYLFKTGAPTDNTVVELQSDSAGVPSGTVLATIATVDNATLGTTTPASPTTWGSLGVSLTAGTSYWVVFSRSGAIDSGNYIRARVGASAIPYFLSNAGVWSSAGLTNGVSGDVVMATSTVYLTDTASAVSTASVDKEAWTSRGSGVTSIVTNTSTGWTAPVQATDTAGGTVVDWFTRPLTAFTLTGMAVLNIRALESNAAANASLRAEIARVETDGTSPTVWCSWCCAPTGTDNGELTTSEVARTINLSGDDLAITNGQRLRIRLYNEDSSSAAMVTGHTVTRYYGGTSGGASGDSYITFPQTLTEYSMGPATIERSASLSGG